MTTRRRMKTEICQSTTWTPATRTTNRRRKRAAALVPRAPALRRAPPAPVLGRGPGKRVQVQGNSRQNVSISSILHMTHRSTSVPCPALLCCFFVLSFCLLSPLPFRSAPLRTPQFRCKLIRTQAAVRAAALIELLAVCTGSTVDISPFHTGGEASVLLKVTWRQVSPTAAENLNTVQFDDVCTCTRNTSTSATLSLLYFHVI